MRYPGLQTRLNRQSFDCLAIPLSLCPYSSISYFPNCFWLLSLHSPSAFTLYLPLIPSASIFSLYLFPLPSLTIHSLPSLYLLPLPSPSTFSLSTLHPPHHLFFLHCMRLLIFPRKIRNLQPTRPLPLPLLTLLPPPPLPAKLFLPLCCCCFCYLVDRHCCLYLLIVVDSPPAPSLSLSLSYSLSGLVACVLLPLFVFVHYQLSGSPSPPH